MPGDCQMPRECIERLTRIEDKLDIRKTEHEKLLDSDRKQWLVIDSLKQWRAYTTGAIAMIAFIFSALLALKK
jgi:hypothetical protein